MSSNTIHVIVGDIEARYRGGAYIDLHHRFGPEAGQAYDCINVWDYEQDRPVIAATRDAVQAEVERIVAEDPDGRGDPNRYI